MQFVFKLVKQFKRISAFTVHLVDKDDNRCMPHPADLHELFSLFLNTFDAIDYKNDTVNRSQRPVCIFRKVLVTWRVENIDTFTCIFESHDRSSNRYSSLLFDFHEIAGRRFTDLVAFYCTGGLNCTAKKKKFFSQRCFSRIRMADDCKRFPFRRFLY